MNVTPPQFIIGTWLQPRASFHTWRDRGCNTLVGWKSEGGVARGDWLKLANEAGLFYILECPTSPETIARDEADPFCLGYLLEPDEPEGAGGAAAWQMQHAHDQLRAAGAKKPAMISFESYNMVWRRMADYQLYAKACQWGGEDTYPVNQGLPLAEKLFRIKLQKALGLEVLSFIECSDQGIGGTWPAHANPTPASFRQQLTAVANEGVRGVIYFPQRDRTSPAGPAMDVMQPDVELVMRELNPKLAHPAPTRPPINAAVMLDGYLPANFILSPKPS